MALVKTSLENDIKSLLLDELGKSDEEKKENGGKNAVDDFAKKLAAAIDKYIKTATVNVTVATTGSASAQTGTGTGTLS